MSVGAAPNLRAGTGGRFVRRSAHFGLRRISLRDPSRSVASQVGPQIFSFNQSSHARSVPAARGASLAHTAPRCARRQRRPQVSSSRLSYIVAFVTNWRPCFAMLFSTQWHDPVQAARQLWCSCRGKASSRASCSILTARWSTATRCTS